MNQYIRYLLIFIILVMPSCSDNGQKKEHLQETNKAVTTILPIYFAVSQVGRGVVEVTNLLPPGGSPHTYAPTPEEIKEAENADIIFKLGLNLDDWMDEIIRSSKLQDTPVIVVSKNIETIHLNHSDCKNHHHQHDNGDPHIWMDPVRMKTIALNIKEALIEKFPQKKETIEKNYKQYVNSLDQLDKKYSQSLSNLKNKDYVTFHSFMTYLGRRYDINQIAVISEFPGKEPDPRHIAEVVDLLKEKKVKVVFVEPQFSDKASRAIAREINGEILVIDPLGNPYDSERNTYIKNMEKNLENLIKAFKQN
ncbi:MAG: metal ABC transporter substrate-binding protein [Vulcanimicrobiota bacterium]